MPTNVNTEKTSKFSFKLLLRLKKFSQSALAKDASSEDPPLLFYDKSNIDRLVWPDNEESRFAQQYLTPLIKKGPHHYIDNIDGQMGVLIFDGHAIPILVIDNNYANSYVCSPYAHYISLALESLFLIKRASLRKLGEYALKGLGKILQKGRINQIVYVNHWLLSTDLYPHNFTLKHVQQITAFLIQKFPQHVIAFRSLNAHTNAQLQQDLKQSGFAFIASRSIFLTDTSNQELFNTRIIKSDLRLWRGHSYELVNSTQLTPADQARLLALYRTLSLQHHSALNPQLNAHFIEHLLERRLLQFKALKKEGTVVGAVGFLTRHQILTCPFFGYDKTQPDSPQLYRLLSTLLMLEAHSRKHLFHQSAGASFYKTIRRATSCLEYLGFYAHHLPRSQKWSWRILKAVINGIAVRFMQKY